MMQRIVGRIRLFLLLCGIWGALFFSIANVNSDVWFFPTMDFYILYQIGYTYVIFLLIRGFLNNGEHLRRSGNRGNDLPTYTFFLLAIAFVFIPAIGSPSLWWRTLESPSSMEVYFAMNKEGPFSIDPTDFFSLIFLLICLLSCCMPTQTLSSIIKLDYSFEVFKGLWPYQKKDNEDIFEFQKNKNILNAFLPDIKILEESNTFIIVCRYVASYCMFFICLPFILIESILKLMFGKGFMLKMVGNFEQAEMCEIKNLRVRMFFDRISMYVLLIFASLYWHVWINSIYRNLYNIYGQEEDYPITILFAILITSVIIIWAGYDNLIITKKIHEQEVYDLSKNNKNWMLLYAHQLINTGQTIIDDVSLLREMDEPELRIDDLKANTQILLDDGEKCLDYAQALSKQPLIETVDLINMCEKMITEIEDDKKTAAFCIDDDILLEYNGNDIPYLIKTDESILHKILYKLIVNAVRYRIPGTAVIINIKKTKAVIHLKIENAITLKDADKMQEYLHKIDAFWNWQNVSSAGDISLGLIFTKGYAEMVDIGINYIVNKKITFSANLEIPMA